MRYVLMRFNAFLKVSALRSSPLRSSADSSDCNTDITLVRPTMLGNDSVTPNAG